MDINIKYLNESFVYVDCSDSIFFEMKDFFSFFADGYQFNPKYKYGTWSGKIYLLNNDRTLPYGLASRVQKFASNMDYSLFIDPEINSRENYSDELIRKWINKFSIKSKGNTITPHWYQYDAVIEGIKAKKCILNLPTSAGKSLIQALLTRFYVDRHEGNVLVLVPTTGLVVQMRDDFVDYRLFDIDDIDCLGGKHKLKGNKRIVISTWQSAIKQSKEWLSQFGCLLIDECHLANGQSITSINQGLINCIYKIGLSGSLKDGKANMMQYVGLFGNIFKPVSTADLIEEGQVSKLNIKMVFMPYSDEFKKANKGLIYRDELKAVLLNKDRTDFISRFAIKLAKRDENIFLMFKITDHGKMLFEKIKSLGYEKVYFVNGGVDSDERNDIKSIVEKNKGVIVVASYGVFSTGISINNLHHVILAHPVKSSITIKQTIGRVLRKHGSKDVAIVWDMVDDLSTRKVNPAGIPKRINVNYILKHAFDRIKVYDEEKFDYTINDSPKLLG